MKNYDEKGSVTSRVKNAKNPLEELHNIFNNARYLVARSAPEGVSKVTKIGYYRGRQVIPAPKANPKVSTTIGDQTIEHLMFQCGITLTNAIGVNADMADDLNDQNLAPYLVMTDAEADDYEKELMIQAGMDPKKGKSKAKKEPNIKDEMFDSSSLASAIGG